MKKLILALATVVVVGLSSPGPVQAQGDDAPVDCIDKPSSDPGDPCYNPVLYPPTTPQTSVLPPATTTTVAAATTTSVAAATTTTTMASALTPNLPATGASGMSPILGMGALLILGGGLVVVAARRRSTATSPAA